MKRLTMIWTWVGIMVALAFLGLGRVKGEDTDGDRLDDQDEIEVYETNPSEADTDEDGLEDGEEVEKYKTDPTEKDTAGDGYEDGEEVDEGSDPNNPESVPQD